MSLFENLSFVGRAKEEHIEERLHRNVLLFCDKLARIHGAGHLSLESGGLHLYLPCPVCLERHGPSELQKRHLAINLDKYFLTGVYSDSRNTSDGRRLMRRSGQCMKHGVEKVSVPELEKWEILEKRKLPIPLPECPREVSVYSAKRAKHLVRDAQGNLIPDGPGEVTDLATLDEHHPAIEYLRRRRFHDLKNILQVSRTVWCSAPRPETPDRRYMKLPHAFEQSAGGRIVFYCDIAGVQQGWQARALERESKDGLRRAWYNYSYGRYVDTEWRTVKDKKWSLLGEVEGVAFDLHKYWFSPGILRNSVLLGVDSAVAWNRALGVRRPFCVLVEGPLDAGRLGNPAVALFGKFCSPEQARVISAFFRDVYVIRDRDAAGEKMLGYVQKNLEGKVNVHPIDLPEETFEDEHGCRHAAKDPGDLSHETADRLMSEIICRNL